MLFGEMAVGGAGGLGSQAATPSTNLREELQAFGLSVSHFLDYGLKIKESRIRQRWCLKGAETDLEVGVRGRGAVALHVDEPGRRHRHPIRRHPQRLFVPVWIHLEVEGPIRGSPVSSNHIFQVIQPRLIFFSHTVARRAVP